MAQVTIHKEPGVEVEVIDGSPPEDQSALVATLTARVDELSAQVSALQAKITAAVAALA